MECNRDEATRAKEIAEKKFTAKDVAGAKKFATKAQTLYPGLEGIQQMLATLDVYISAENKINGESDWYGILGANPRADDETVRKHYRKLALMLHPDKNKSIGADGAFKLISEAWSFLSDKTRRLAYDQKRNIKIVPQKVPKPTPTPTPTGGNGFHNFAKSSSTSQTKVPKNNAHRTNASSAPASSHKQKPTTFWTVCHRCKMQYEYLRLYLNHNLLCPNCHEPFFAIETAPPPSNGSKASTHSNHPQKHPLKRQNSNHQGLNKNEPNTKRNKSTTPNVGSGGFRGPDSSNNTKFQWGPFSKTGGATNAADAATMVQQAYEKVKREREEAQAALKKVEALRRKNNASKKMSGVSSSGSARTAKRRKVMEDIGTNQKNLGINVSGFTNLSGSKQGLSEPGKASGTYKPSITRDVSHSDIQNMLMEKARTEIRDKLEEWNSATAPKSAVTGEENLNEKVKEKEIGKDNFTVNGERKDQNETGKPVDTKNVFDVDESSSRKEAIEPMSINVPDPDFHDFDKDRTERCFAENQVWAAYDNDDGMPRYYAMVHNVISSSPFKMRISWLNSKTNSELGPLNWVSSGFSKTCGDFRIGKHEINHSLNSFSHKVRWTKGTHGVIHIFPRQGDVWALYRNWSPEWNEMTENEVIHKYDMVEVLEDYEEESGVTVTPLVKVAGFKTVFHRHLDHREVRMIPKEEMFRFSHQVPSYLLTGQEAPNAPKGCRELDPAGTPIELLQVIANVQEDEIVEREDEVMEDETINEDMEVNFSKAREEMSEHTRGPEEIEMEAASKKTKKSDRLEPAEENAIS